MSAGEHDLRGTLYVIFDREISFLEQSKFRSDIEVVLNWVELISVEEVISIPLVDIVADTETGRN